MPREGITLRYLSRCAQSAYPAPSLLQPSRLGQSLVELETKDAQASGPARSRPAAMGRYEEDAEAPREHREHRSHKSHKSHRREHKHDRYDKTDRPEKDLRDRDVNKNSGQQGSGEASPGRQRDEAAPALAFDKPQGNETGGENSMSIEETNRCASAFHCSVPACGLVFIFCPRVLSARRALSHPVKCPRC